MHPKGAFQLSLLRCILGMTTDIIKIGQLFIFTVRLTSKFKISFDRINAILFCIPILLFWDYTDWCNL